MPLAPGNDKSSEAAASLPPGIPWNSRLSETLERKLPVQTVDFASLFRYCLRMKLISVHMPKAGGTSIKLSLKETFGSSFRLENEDDPTRPDSERNMNPARYFGRRRVLPPEVDCIHGHFHPGQFDLQQNAFLFTLLRHPVSNMISIYSFWKSLPSQNHSLHDYFLSKRLSIIELAHLPALRWLYSRTYFGGFDMDRFNLVGRHEHREDALARLADAIGVDLDKHNHENSTPVSEERKALMSDPLLLGRLHTILADDIRFYEASCTI